MDVAIIGSGFSGINMAINLLKNNIDSFIVFEKSGEIGGVWRDNIYPGCTCDIKAALYSLKTEPNPNWSSNFPKQNEIYDYLQSIAKKYDLYNKIQLNTTINVLVFDEKEGYWKIESTVGNYHAKAVILATGPQRLPAFPAISGINTFTEKSFHSSKWDRSVDLTGLKVAVVGTGASSIQIVPSIQPKVAQLYLFQRTPAWILPRMQRNTFDIERKLYTLSPFLLRTKREMIFWFYEWIGSSFNRNKLLHKILTTISKARLKAVIKDKIIRQKLIPGYRLGCKRILVSDDFYKCLNKPNVCLVTDSINRISENSIHTDIRDYNVDAIIFATGFTVADADSYIEIRGLNGKNFNDMWAKYGAEAYLGTHISDLPNLCYLLGPNSGLSHSSVLHAMESQVNYVIQYLKYLKAQPPGSFLNVKSEVQRIYNDSLQQKLKGTVWDSGCTSWFLNKQNRNTVIFPGSLVSFRKATKTFNSYNYETKKYGRE